MECKLRKNACKYSDKRILSYLLYTYTCMYIINIYIYMYIQQNQIHLYTHSSINKLVQHEEHVKKSLHPGNCLKSSKKTIIIENRVIKFHTHTHTHIYIAISIKQDIKYNQKTLNAIQYIFSTSRYVRQEHTDIITLV